MRQEQYEAIAPKQKLKLGEQQKSVDLFASDDDENDENNGGQDEN